MFAMKFAIVTWAERKEFHFNLPIIAEWRDTKDSGANDAGSERRGGRGGTRIIRSRPNDSKSIKD